MGKGRLCYRCGKASKKARQIPERLLRKISGCCAVTEVDRKTHNDYYTHTFGVSLVKSLGIYDKAKINTGLQGDQWSPLQADSKTNTVFRRTMAPARGTFSPCPDLRKNDPGWLPCCCSLMVLSTELLRWGEGQCPKKDASGSPCLHLSW